VELEAVDDGGQAALVPGHVWTQATKKLERTGKRTDQIQIYNGIGPTPQV
jgi:hypothetical protein